MPKISIIMPTFNVEKYIARAIKSCINQTFKDIEIIIVDDLGSDNSINIAKEYAKKDERIKIIHNEKNLGTFAARNAGIKAAEGEYLLFLDPDDYLELNACELVINEIQDYDLLCFNAIIVNNEDKNYKKNYDNAIFNLRDFCSFLDNKNLALFVCNKIYKKSLLIDKIKEIDFKERLIYAEDHLFNAFYLSQCKKIKCIDNFLYNYYQHSQSITNNFANNHKNIFLQLDLLLLKLQSILIDDYVKEFILKRTKKLYYNISLELYLLDIKNKYNLIDKKYFFLRFLYRLKMSIKKKIFSLKYKKGKTNNAN